MFIDREGIGGDKLSLEERVTLQVSVPKEESRILNTPATQNQVNSGDGHDTETGQSGLSCRGICAIHILI